MPEDFLSPTLLIFVIDLRDTDYLLGSGTL